MSHTMNLKELERKAFRSTFQDGLWDIFIGIVFLNFAVGSWLTNLGWGDFWGSMAMLPINLLAYAGLWLGKRHITAPRLGRVQFGPARQRRIRRLIPIISIIIAAAALFGLAQFTWSEAPSGRLIPLIAWAVIWMAIFGLAAYWLDVPRFWIYGALSSITYQVGVVLKDSGLWGVKSAFAPYFVTGPIIVLIGLILFVRFLRYYPKPVLEEADGNV